MASGGPGTDPGWRVLAAGAGFTEGPLWHAGSVYFVSLSRGRLMRVPLEPPGPGRPPLTAVEVADVRGGPNGLASGPDGSILVAQNGLTMPNRRHEATPPGIQQVDPHTGAVRRATARRTDAPNDLAIGPDGRLWFTDPRGNPIDDPQPGAVRVLDLATGELTTAARGLSYPNGLAFHPGTGDLHVAESATRSILRFPVTPDGLGPPAVHAADLPDQPDGIAFDENGQLYVAATTADCVLVLAEDGGVAQALSVPGPAMVTNVCFAGPDLSTLIATAAKGGRVLAAPAPTRGAPLHQAPSPPTPHEEGSTT